MSGQYFSRDPTTNIESVYLLGRRQEYPDMCSPGQIRWQLVESFWMPDPFVCVSYVGPMPESQGTLFQHQKFLLQHVLVRRL